MNWQFWEYSDDPSKPCKDDDLDNKVCGSLAHLRGLTIRGVSYQIQRTQDMVLDVFSD